MSHYATFQKIIQLFSGELDNLSHPTWQLFLGLMIFLGFRFSGAMIFDGPTPGQLPVREVRNDSPRTGNLRQMG